MDLNKIYKITDLNELRDLTLCYKTYNKNELESLLSDKEKQESTLNNINNKIELIKHTRNIMYGEITRLNKYLIKLENEFSLYSKQLELLETQKEYAEVKMNCDNFKKTF